MTPTYISPRLRRTSEDIVATQLLLTNTNTLPPREKGHNPDSCHTIRHTLDTILRHTVQKSGVPASQIGGIEVANPPAPLPTTSPLSKLQTSSPHATASALHASLTAAQSLFPSTISYAVNPSAHSGGLQAVQSIASQIRNGRFEIGIAAGVDPLVPRGSSQSGGESGAAELGVADDEAEAYRVLSLGRMEAVGGDGGCWRGEAEMGSSAGDVVGGAVPSRHGGADTDGEAGGEVQDDGVASLHDDDSSAPTLLTTASLLLMTRATALRLHQPIHAHYVAATSSPPMAFPTNPHAAPCNAIQHLFHQTGLSTDDIDVFEIEELSAAAVVYCVRTLGLGQQRVNASGGAMGWGDVGGVEGLREVVMGLEESGRKGGRVVVVAVGGRDVGGGTVGIWVNEVGV